VQFHDKERPKRVTLVNMAACPQRPSYDSGGPTAGGNGTPDGRDLYLSEPRRACFDNGDWSADPAQALYEKLWRFWTAPPLSVAPVAAPTLSRGFSDGAEVPSA